MAENETVLYDGESKKRKIWKKIKGSFFLQTLKLIILLAILAALGAGYAVIEKKSDPSVVANQYLGGYISGNADLIYEVIEQKDNSLLNVEALKAMLIQNPDFGKLPQAELGDYEKTEDGLVYHVAYEDSETGEEKQLEIKLVEDSPSIFKLIKKWKVDISEQVAYTVKFSVPKGCTLYIDGQPGENKKTETVEGKEAVVYYAKGIYKGQHQLSIQSPYLDTIEIKTDITESDTELNYLQETLVPRQDVVEALAKFNTDTVAAMYGLAADYSGVKKATALFPNQKTVQTKVKEAYQRMRKQLYGEVLENREEFEVETLKLDSFQLKYKKFKQPNIALIRFDGAMSFKTSRKTTFYDGYTTSYEGRYQVNVLYTVQINPDGTYEITDIKFSMSEKK